MRVRAVAVMAVAGVLTATGVAFAAPRLKPAASYFYVRAGHFSVSLRTTASGKGIAAGMPGAGHQFPVSSMIVLCPASAPGAAPVELQFGFPGAKLKLVKHRYRFTRSYTPGKADLVTFTPKTSTPLAGVKVKISGTVTQAKGISGTVSVTATGCSMKSSSYKATIWAPQPM